MLGLLKPKPNPWTEDLFFEIGQSADGEWTMNNKKLPTSVQQKIESAYGNPQANVVIDYLHSLGEVVEYTNFGEIEHDFTRYVLIDVRRLDKKEAENVAKKVYCKNARKDTEKSRAVREKYGLRVKEDGTLKTCTEYDGFMLANVAD
jgi:hypothetical protein